MTDDADIEIEIELLIEKFVSLGLGHREIMRVLTDRYGARTWAEVRVRIHVWKHRHHQRGQRSLVERDAGVRAIVDDLILIRPLRAIRATLWIKVGPRRTPSRRALYRYARRYRLMLRMLDRPNRL